MSGMGFLPMVLDPVGAAVHAVTGLPTLSSTLGDAISPSRPEPQPAATPPTVKAPAPAPNVTIIGRQAQAQSQAPLQAQEPAPIAASKAGADASSDVTRGLLSPRSRRALLA